MSASVKAAEVPQKEKEYQHHPLGEHAELPEVLSRPSAEDLEVARSWCGLRASVGPR